MQWPHEGVVKSADTDDWRLVRSHPMPAGAGESLVTGTEGHGSSTGRLDGGGHKVSGCLSSWGLCT